MQRYKSCHGTRQWRIRTIVPEGERVAVSSGQLFVTRGRGIIFNSAWPFEWVLSLMLNEYAVAGCSAWGGFSMTVPRHSSSALLDASKGRNSSCDNSPTLCDAAGWQLFAVQRHCETTGAALSCLLFLCISNKGFLRKGLVQRQRAVFKVTGILALQPQALLALVFDTAPEEGWESIQKLPGTEENTQSCSKGKSHAVAALCSEQGSPA